MKHDKHFYIAMPQINGFKWAFYDNGLHCFSKQVGNMYASCYLTENDIENNFAFMLSNELTREAK